MKHINHNGKKIAHKTHLFAQCIIHSQAYLAQDSQEEEEDAESFATQRLLTQEGLTDVQVVLQPNDFGHEGIQEERDDLANDDDPKILTKVLQDRDITTSAYATSQNNASLRIFNPTYTRNDDPDKYAEIMLGRPVVNTTVKNPPHCNTNIPVPAYTNFLSDPVFVRMHHQVVNGKILRWRNESMRLITQLVHIARYDENELLDQFVFARSKVFEIMKGLNSHSVLPAGVLNPMALKKYVEGVDSEETADFVHHMAVCNTYEIIPQHRQCLNSDYREIMVITRFNGVVKRAYGYAKERIRNDRAANGVFGSNEDNTNADVLQVNLF